jgi:hypothetical protein
MIMHNSDTRSCVMWEARAAAAAHSSAHGTASDQAARWLCCGPAAASTARVADVGRHSPYGCRAPPSASPRRLAPCTHRACWAGPCGPATSLDWRRSSSLRPFKSACARACEPRRPPRPAVPRGMQHPIGSWQLRPSGPCVAAARSGKVGALELVCPA